jgi:hypothetical protein
MGVLKEIILHLGNLRLNPSVLVDITERVYGNVTTYY